VNLEKERSGKLIKII